MVERSVGVARAPADRVFFPLAALTIIIFVVFGFAPTYYFKAFTDAPTLRPVLHLHGLLFSAWLALFLVQTLLIRQGKVSVHRRLGMTGAGLAVLMIIVGTVVTIQLGPLFPAPEWLFAITFGDLVMFAAFVGLGILYRTNSPAHKRLMLLATVAIIDAGTSRWPFVIAMLEDDPASTLGTVLMWLLADLPIVAAIVYDRIVHARIHPVLIWGGLALVLSQWARLAVQQTEQWQTLSAALVRMAT